MTWNSQDPIFEQLIPAILIWEGGSKLVNHPRDPGGKTKYGISERFNSGRLQQLGTTIAKLTEDQARKIYFEDYYLKSEAHEMEDNGLTLIHFDAAINHGVNAAKRMKSQLFTNPQFYAGSGLNKGIFNELSLDYLRLRMERYTNDPNEDVFLEGWINRLEKLMKSHVQLWKHPELPLSVT